MRSAAMPESSVMGMGARRRTADPAVSALSTNGGNRSETVTENGHYGEIHSSECARVNSRFLLSPRRAPPARSLKIHKRVNKTTRDPAPPTTAANPKATTDSQQGAIAGHHQRRRPSRADT